jgi:hypothetical protein
VLIETRCIYHKTHTYWYRLKGRYARWAAKTVQGFSPRVPDLRSGAGGQHAAAAVGAPAGGDVEPLDPHGRRERRGKIGVVTTAAAVRGAVAVTAQVVKNPELRGELVPQEVRVVHQRVVRARRRRPAEQRPAPVLVAAAGLYLRRLGLAFLLPKGEKNLCKQANTSNKALGRGKKS